MNNARGGRFWQIIILAVLLVLLGFALLLTVPRSSAPPLPGAPAHKNSASEPNVGSALPSSPTPPAPLILPGSEDELNQQGSGGK